MDGAIPARSVRDSAERRTLIRPPLVNRESTPVAGFVPRERARRSGSRGAADFISTVASDTVVCTKHLLRLEPATTRHLRHQRGARQRLRGLETHLCPPVGRLKTTGSGRRPVPVSTQLGGRGSPQLVESTSRHQMSSEHGSLINAQDSGTFAPRCSSAVGAARVFGASARAQSHGGSS